MEEVKCNILMATLLKESGLKEKLMDLVFLNIKVEAYMKAFGLMICKMEIIFENGLIKTIKE
jgi:hypothetical protein